MRCQVHDGVVAGVMPRKWFRVARLQGLGMSLRARAEASHTACRLRRCGVMFGDRVEVPGEDPRAGDEGKQLVRLRADVCRRVRVKGSFEMDEGLQK